MLQAGFSTYCRVCLASAETAEGMQENTDKTSTNEKIKAKKRFDFVFTNLPFLLFKAIHPFVNI